MQIPRRCKNRGNEAKKLLKTKQVRFKTNSSETNFGPQASVSIVCLNSPWIIGIRELDPGANGMTREPNRGVLESATKYENCGNEAEKLLKRQDLTFSDDANDARFAHKSD